MVEEVLRRLRNCDPEASWEEREKHLTEFAISMKSSGHSEHFRKIVFNKAVARFCKELDAHVGGDVDMYRSREERHRQTEQKGGKSTNDSWFRKIEGEGGERVTSVFRVPYTPRSKLREAVTKSLSGNMAPAGLKTRIQEDGGSKLAFKLVKSDPFPREICQRHTCPITRGEQQCREMCFQSHANYVILCNRCDPPEEVTLTSHGANQPAQAPASAEPLGDPEQQSAATAAQQRPPHALYLGETSRGCKIRFEQHVSDYKAGKGFMHEHTAKAHGGERGDDPATDYYMKLCAVDKDPIRRVVRESVRIKNAREREDEGGGTAVFNDKSEWFGVKVVTVDFRQE